MPGQTAPRSAGRNTVRAKQGRHEQSVLVRHFSRFPAFRSRLTDRAARAGEHHAVVHRALRSAGASASVAAGTGRGYRAEQVQRHPFCARAWNHVSFMPCNDGRPVSEVRRRHADDRDCARRRTKPHNLCTSLRFSAVEGAGRDVQKGAASSVSQTPQQCQPDTAAVSDRHVSRVRWTRQRCQR